MKLINQSSINKWVIKSNKDFKFIFEYEPENENLLVIGFVTKSNEVVTDKLYLPSIMDNGMLSLNGKIWYPPQIVLPPIKAEYHYIDKEPEVRYLNTLISTNYAASKLNEFMPFTEKYQIKKYLRTPLFEELNTKTANASDLYQWNILSLEHLIIELFNHKIAIAANRSFRKGNKGVYSVKKSLMTLIGNSLRYYDNENNVDLHEFEFETETDYFNRSVFVEDKLDTVILPDIVHSIKLNIDSPIDFCTCSSGSPGNTAHLKDGVVIRNCKIVEKATYPYAKSRRGIVGLLNDDPNRVVVSRNITRSLPLKSPDVPWVVTDFPYSIDSLSLPGIHMTHPLNCEDGIIVSKTFASKMGAYKQYTTSIDVPENASFKINVQSLEDTEDGRMALNWEDTYKDAIKTLESVKSAPYIIQAGANLIELDVQIPVEEFDPDNSNMYTGVNKSGVVDKYYMKKFINSKSVYRSVITSIKVYDSNITNETNRKIIIGYTSFVPLSVGDKISDGHGNKATISTIIPDSKMPVWNGNERSIRAHYIATPFRAKRLAVGAEIEDKLSMISEHEDYNMEVKSDKIFSMKEINQQLVDAGLSYTGTVVYGDKEYNDISLSNRRMFRLDNNVSESLSWAGKLNVGTGNNCKLGMEIVSLLSRKAENLVLEYIRESNRNVDFKDVILPYLNAFGSKIPKHAKTYTITERINSSYLGKVMNSITVKNMNRENTVVDIRNNQGMYGVIQYKDKTIVLPPKTDFNRITVGCYSFNKLAVAMNNILCDIISEKQGYYVNVDKKIENYYNELSKALTGKHGKIKSTLMPVFPVNIHGVVSSYVSENLYEIALPAKAFKGICLQNPDIEKLYGKEGTVLIKRDPTHDNNSIFAVNYVLWNNDSIGIPPWLIVLLSGDYDGDAITASFPTSAAGIKDLELLYPEIPVSSKLGKQFISDQDNPFDALYDNIGYGSTFDNLADNDEVKNTELYKHLIDGTVDHSRYNIRAMRNFTTIKHGTARTGAIGLRAIYTRDLSDLTVLNQSMDFYHKIAQNTLDAKSGISVPALEFVKYYHSKETKDNTKLIGIRNTLKSLNVCDNMIDIVYNLSNMEENSGNSLDFLKEHFPVLATVHSNAGIEETQSLIERMSGESEIKGGIFESLFTLMVKYANNEDWIGHVADLREILN